MENKKDKTEQVCGGAEKAKEKGKEPSSKLFLGNTALGKVRLKRLRNYW